MSKKNKEKKRGSKKATPKDVKESVSVIDNKINNANNDTVVDDRFDSSKPQFRKDQQKANKIVLDDRFAGLLKDSRFQLDVRDKYGRPQLKSLNHGELSAFYTVVSNNNNSNNSNQVENNNNNNNNNSNNQVENENKSQKSDETDSVETIGNSTGSSSTTSSSSSSSSSSSNNGSDSDDSSDSRKKNNVKTKKAKDENPASRIAYLTALSRGELNLSSSSSSSSDENSDDSSSDDDDGTDYEQDNQQEDSQVGVLDPTYNAVEPDLTFETSPYMAVLNMDWDHVRATDIFAIMASFGASSVSKVQVYPSDFGLERMAMEDKVGPQNLWKDSNSKKTLVNASMNKHDENNSDVDGHDNQHEYSKDIEETDFDPEKLREYEASRLKYYFAVVEFTSSEVADLVYKELDGMELEHSSAALDLRMIAPSEIPTITSGRPLRDEAVVLESNYAPPDFVVSALQQTSVQCTWEVGDLERERKLTKYSNGTSWQSMAESDDLKAYLASDHSSDDDDDNDSNGVENNKASRIRKLLGLDSDNDSEGKDQENDKEREEIYDNSGSSGEEDNKIVDNDDDDKDDVKEYTYVPGETKLEDKIRSKLQSKNEKEKTPWEQYLEKKKEKRKEKKRSAREKRNEVNKLRQGEHVSSDKQTTKSDSFFLSNEKAGSGDDANSDNDDDDEPKAMSREELELLMAGDDQDEQARDYDIRGLQRITKNKDKKLKGSRKRKEEKLAMAVTGTDFEIDVQDDRFKALIDGTDDRFGIDRTDPNFKETPAMQKIMKEQTKRRKTKRQKVASDVASRQGKDGSTVLQSLVKSIKAKVKK